MTAPVVVRSRGSFRTEVEAGSHRFVLDEPESAGGTNAGPTPYDAVAAGLGGCTAMTLHFYAKREKIPLEGVDVTVVHDRQHAKDCADCMTQSGYIHRFKLQLALHGVLTAEQRTKLLEIAARCPVAKMLGAEIRIDHELAEAP
ncbi:MAG: OsmC family protein [Thermoanaerobaculia bacterium]